MKLSKHELDVLLYYLDWKIMEIKETGNDFEYPEIENIYTKLTEDTKWNLSDVHLSPSLQQSKAQ